MHVHIYICIYKYVNTWIYLITYVLSLSFYLLTVYIHGTILRTIISQTASKTFATQCFYTDHLKHKTANKTSCRTPSENPHQLCTH